MADFPTLQDIVLAAKAKLPNATWDFVTFGSESETTVRRNRHALDSLAFRPRVLRDVMEIDTTTNLLGVPLRIPVMMAPVGSLHLLDPGAAVTVARAAAEFGTMPIISGFADPGFEQVAEAVKTPLAYALHPRADMAFMDDLVDRVKAHGYRAIVYVSEGAYYSRRERDLMSGIQTKAKRSRTYASYQQQLREERAKAPGKAPSYEGLLGAGGTWALVDRIKSRSGLPLVLKGITTAEDARLAAEHGVDVVYVSNHGGRSLDHARGTIQTLPEIKAAVGEKAKVIIDGGFVRGTDVLKAISLGASAVCMGRMQAWAVAAGGQAGLVRALEILEEEIIVNMGLLGVTKLEQLAPSYVAPVEPVGPPHPLSAFPVALERISEGRN
ncbi:MAG: alpha-hydroxy acid oxidase [Alphaproteobacteria bacterium]